MTSAEATTESLLSVIDGLNADALVNAILLQLPIPDSVDRFRLFDAIAPIKDLDAVSSASVGGFYRGEWGRFIPCTPRGVLTLLDHYQVPVDGARATIIGRSDIAGKPTALILGGRLRNATSPGVIATPATSVRFAARPTFSSRASAPIPAVHS